ncbi:MAG: glycoside hydrolase family 2 TIM barrel-domain containing protein [Planctomycetota bacterium]
MRLAWLTLLALLAQPAGAQDAATTSAPKKPRLQTRWAADVDPSAPRPEYPRPQLVRSRWLNLNGTWDLSITGADEAPAYDARVLVPFPLESALSGVATALRPEQCARYRRTFRVPAAWRSERIWLHFGAVDWEARVRVNGTDLGTHRGGYDPFSVDITPALQEDEEQELVVEVRDPTDRSTQPRGKQVLRPGGIWYTPTSGIWQTVWLEPVPALGIGGLRLRTRVDPAQVEVQVDGRVEGLRLVAEVGTPGPESATAPVLAEGPADAPLTVAIPHPRLWTPDSPTLYELHLTLENGGETIDRVQSYFGLREIARGVVDGKPRLLLNGKPLFQLGPLDQGFWPDGLYTAPTDAALRFDLEATKELGFNMVRKHVKVEPATWYAHCDRLGLLVWQDMPSGDRYIGSRDPDVERSRESAQQYERELCAVMDALRNHPSLVMWVPFNEGWGQFDTARIAELVHRRDPTRLVDSASGWTDRGVGDVHDVHVYPGPGMPPVEAERAAVLGEFGGLGLPLAGHTWQDEKNWGYRSFDDQAALTDAYVEVLSELPFLIERGLCAAVYTQTTDVEIEVNGLLTYDREVWKMDRARVRAANLAVHQPPPKIEVLAPCAEQGRVEWRYSTGKPETGWQDASFDDSSWQVGAGGFGTEGTPGARIGTAWQTGDIWLRRHFALPADIDPAGLRLRLHHDEDVEVYVNGIEVAHQKGYRTSYRYLAPSTRSPFRAGDNVLAVHCKQTTGGQYVDVGVVRW